MPSQLQKGDVFVDGQTVNAARLNNLVDAAIALKGVINEQTPVAIATNDYILFTDTSNSGALQKGLVSSMPGAGTVTSLSMTVAPTSIFSVAVTNPTTTPAIAFATHAQIAGLVLASPVSTTGVPSFRALVPTDIPIATTTIAALNIDWNLGSSFLKGLAANSTFTFSNANEGQTIRVALVQGSPVRTVAWPATVRWKGGTAPVMTATAGCTDIYTFHKFGGVFYGVADQNFHA